MVLLTTTTTTWMPPSPATSARTATSAPLSATAAVAATTDPMGTGKMTHGRMAHGRIPGGRTAGALRWMTTGTRLMTTPNCPSWMPSHTRLTPTISTPAGPAPGVRGGRARPTCHQDRRAPAPSAACPARLARHDRHARLRATRRPPLPAQGRASTMPLAARDPGQAALALDRKDRLAPARPILPPGRTIRPPLETQRLSDLVPPGPSRAGSARRSRRDPGRMPRPAPTGNSQDSRARTARSHRSSPRAATRMDRPRPRGASPECR
jgi:hypothetical protein